MVHVYTYHFHICRTGYSNFFIRLPTVWGDSLEKNANLDCDKASESHCHFLKYLTWHFMGHREVTQIWLTVTFRVHAMSIPSHSSFDPQRKRLIPIMISHPHASRSLSLSSTTESFSCAPVFQGKSSGGVLRRGEKGDIFELRRNNSHYQKNFGNTLLNLSTFTYKFNYWQRNFKLWESLPNELKNKNKIFLIWKWKHEFVIFWNKIILQNNGITLHCNLREVQICRYTFVVPSHSPNTQKHVLDTFTWIAA